MSKAPSDATMLRNSKAELSRMIKSVRELEVAVREYRSRATKAEQESAEWKARFDILLRRDGKKP